MESKTFFGALLLNKHCTARLRGEERRLERQQKLMYSRVWREKEQLMDDYIHINVRTPSPQRVSPSPPASLPRRARSSSTAQQQKRQAFYAQLWSEASTSVSPQAQHSSAFSCLQASEGSKPARKAKNPQTPECSKLARKAKNPQTSKCSKPTTTMQTSSTSELSNCDVSPHSRLCSRSQVSESLAKITSSASVPSVGEQADFKPGVQDTACCKGGNCVATAADNCDGKPQSSVQTQPFARVTPNREPVLKSTHKDISRDETSLNKTFKHSCKTFTTDVNSRDSTQERSPSVSGVHSCEVSNCQRPLTPDVKKASDDLPSSLSSGQAPNTPDQISPVSKCSSSSPGHERKESDSASALQRQQRHTKGGARTYSNGRKPRPPARDKAGRNPRIAILSSKFLMSDSAKRDGDCAGRKSLDDETEQSKDRHSNDPQNDPDMNQPKQTDTNESKSHLGNETPLHHPCVFKSRPRSPKKAYVRQMTIDPKLVLPLSAKRYQCQKLATIIPIITVQGHQATLYPNSQAKAGRVVTLEPRVRGWIKRSTSILFSLGNIHSETLRQQSSSSIQTSPRDEQQIVFDNVTSSMMTHSPKGERTAQDKHVPNLEATQLSPNRTLMRLPSQPTPASIHEDDDTSDVVLVPQTIHADPDSPLFKDKDPKDEQKKSRLQTMQWQQKQRTTPKRASVVTFRKLRRVSQS